jgi:hypothetical protein
MLPGSEYLSFSGTNFTDCAPPFTGFFWYGSDYMMIFKGRRAHRTTATDLIARGFKALALPEAPWTVDELAGLERSLKDYYENACVTGTYGNRKFSYFLSLQ